MITSSEQAIQNSVVLFMGYGAEGIPETMGGQSVAWTSDCVAIGTLSEFDGEVRLEIASQNDIPEGLRKIFDGVLINAAGRLGFYSVELEEMCAVDSVSPQVRVQIFSNDDAEPSRVVAVI